MDTALPPRRFDLDWIRILAFALLVPYHVGMIYVPWDWHIKHAPPSHLIEPLMLLTSPWRLSLLFLVSGVATAFLLHKRPQGFLRARSRRLLWPLLFGMLVIVPPQSYIEVLQKAPQAEVVQHGYLPFWWRYLHGGDLHCYVVGKCVDAPEWNHLWFLAYLWAYTLLLVSIRWLLPTPARDAVTRFCTRHIDGTGVLLWPLLALVAARLWLFPHFPSTHDLLDDWYNHAHYLVALAVGHALAFRTRAWDVLAQRRWPLTVTAWLVYAGLLGYYHHYAETSAPMPILVLQRIGWATLQWAAIGAILGHARHVAPGDGPWRRLLTAAVFPLYILHQTVIIVLAWWLQPVAMPSWLEGALLIVLTYALCFAAFLLIRRVRWLQPMFGVRT